MLLPWHQPHMDDGGGVVPGVNPVERVIDHRFAQVSLVVSLAHTLVDGVLKQLARDVYILTDLGKTTTMPVSWQMGRPVCWAVL